METKRKTLKLGQVKVGKDKATGNPYNYITLGNDKNKDPKYNFTVQVRILDANGEVVWKGQNPFVQMRDPHENAPDFIKHDLTISLEEK